jgi:signal transduction histidine kinase
MAESKALAWHGGLSTRLLLLTVAFVMLSEVLIYAPSIGRFRYGYMEDHLVDAHLVSLAVLGMPDNQVSDELGREMLEGALSYGIVLHHPDVKEMVLARPMPHEARLRVDLRDQPFFERILGAAEALVGDGRRMVRVLGPSPRDRTLMVETVIDEAPMRAAMISYSQNFFMVTLVTSLITASLLYFALRWLLVRPMQRITASMIAFRENPENVAGQVATSGRGDEIGRAEIELAHMQQELRTALAQRARLAELGGAMTRINHDLRNILATAQVVSDTVSSSSDPKVKRVAPTLLGAIDRAIALCSQTLSYAAGGASAPVRKPIALRALIDELIEVVGTGAEREVSWINRVDGAVMVSADHGQLARLLGNLARNAMEAGAGAIAFDAALEAGRIVIEISDDGPGLSPRARERLFQPFAGSTRPGGTGLGLAIARELARVHGGDLTLKDTGANGTVFRLVLPHAVEGEVRPRAAVVRLLRP